MQTSPTLSQNYQPKPIQHIDLVNNDKISLHLDLPEELKELPIPALTQPLFSSSSLSSSINEPYKLDKDVPYGCLKNGFKKTFRNYKSSSSPPSTTPSATLEPQTMRELKLKQLKEKMKNSSSKGNVSIIPIELLGECQPLKLNTQVQKDMKQSRLEQQQPLQPLQQPQQLQQQYREPIKQTIKKTTIRKYKLGKSKTHRVVGVLIKDTNTRVKILNAHKELKKTEMNIIKKYLNDKNMIMCGSNAPNEVLRKMYEMLILTGEIQNNNKDIMLHNFLKNE